MKKSLIALAALASVSAFAQTAPAAAPVTVYGLIDISYMKDTSASDYHADGALLHDRNSTSRIGVKGSVDAGGGIKANYNLEAGEIMVTAKPAGEALFNRQAWAGFSGAFGELRAGTQDSVGFQTNVAYDLNGAANDSQAAALAGVPTLGNGGKTLAQYITPEFAGFKGQLGYQPKGDNTALLGTKDAATGIVSIDASSAAKSAYSAALSYVKGPFAAAVAYEGASSNGVKTSVYGSDVSKDVVTASASYDLGVVKLVGTAVNGGDKLRGYNVGAAAPVLGGTVGVQYAKNSDTNNTGIELFANKEILKNTTAYVDLGKKHVDADFNDGAGNFIVGAGDYSVFSVGLIWAF